MCFKRVNFLQAHRVKSVYMKKTVIYCEQNRIYHNIGLQEGSASFYFMSQFQFVLDNR